MIKNKENQEIEAPNRQPNNTKYFWAFNESIGSSDLTCHIVPPPMLVYIASTQEETDMSE